MARARSVSLLLLLLSPLASAQDSASSSTTTSSYREKLTVDHTYYTMQLYKNNAEGMYDRHHVDMTGSSVHDFLSNHSQAAEAVAPGFDFPFYGHMVDRFFITTHGFLSFAPRLHNLMYKTQYVAPLRVKLDPSRSDASTINYLARPDQLTIQWTNVTVAEPYAHPKGGNFTFQVTLRRSGDIAFVYEDVPALLTSDALYDGEPVAGLSDAFLIGDNELHVYHTLNVENPDIMSQTVVLFQAKPTCVQQESCHKCMAFTEASDFKCVWCEQVGRCSDGADRLREHWDLNLCQHANSSSFGQCDALDNKSPAPPPLREEPRGGRLPAEDGRGRGRVPRGKHYEWRTSAGRTAAEGGAGAAANSQPLTADEGVSALTVLSIVISIALVLVLVGLLTAFLYLYGRNNPGGVAEQLAKRLEANYKRFGGEGDDEEHSVELSKQGQKAKKEEEERKNNNNNNNNSITVTF